MTSRLAFSYNREVYALPGRADDIRSQGCNEIIRNKIAEPVTSISSLIETMGMTSSLNNPKSSDTERLKLKYSGHIPEQDIDLMTSIMKAVRNHRGLTAEDVSDTLQTGYLKTSELIGILEIDGFIIRDLFQRCSINSKFL